MADTRPAGGPAHVRDAGREGRGRSGTRDDVQEPNHHDEDSARGARGQPHDQGLRTKIEKIGEIEKFSLKCDFDQYPGKTLKKPGFFKSWNLI